MHLVTQDSYDKWHTQSTITAALTKQKELNQKTIQKIPTRQTKNTRKTKSN